MQPKTFASASPLTVQQDPIPKLTLSAKEVAAALSVGERTFHADVRNRPGFPRPVPLTDSGRVIRWRTADVVAWLGAQPTIEKAAEPSQLRRGRMAQAESAAA